MRIYTNRLSSSTGMERGYAVSNPVAKRSRCGYSAKKLAALLSVFVCSWVFSVSASLAAPRISCKSPVYNFGSVDNTKKLTHAFTIENTGDAPLQIGKVRACCGGNAKIASKLLAPGSNTVLDVSFRLSGRKGAQRKSFYIASNDPKQPWLQLRFAGTAVATVDIQPRFANFREVPDDVPSTTNITIVCNASFSFAITNISCDSKQFAATETGTNGTTHYLTIRTVPPLPPGVNRGTIRLLTDNPKYSTLNIAAVATVASDLVVVPREMALIEGGPKPMPVSRFIAIRSRSKAPFKVLKVEAPDPGIKVKVTPMGEAGYRCMLTNIMPFPDLDGKHVVIITDHPKMLRIVVPIKLIDKTD